MFNIKITIFWTFAYLSIINIIKINSILNDELFHEEYFIILFAYTYTKHDSSIFHGN